MDKEFKPFKILDFVDEFGVGLSWNNFYYNWINETMYDWAPKEQDRTKYYKVNEGPGDCYEDLFRDYLEENFKELSSRLEYNSYIDEFYAWCKSMEDAKQVARELSKLYNDKDKMLKLIKITKEKYKYDFL